MYHSHTVKGKFCLYTGHESGSGTIALSHWSHSTAKLCGMSGQLQASAILPSGKAPTICVEYEAGWAHSRTGRFGRKPGYPGCSITLPSRCIDWTDRAGYFQERSQNCEKRPLIWSCLFVHLSAWNNWVRTGWIFMKIDICGFFWKICRENWSLIEIWQQNGHFSLKPMFIYYNISPNSSVLVSFFPCLWI
jgi:hypothetical protein